MDQLEPVSPLSKIFDFNEPFNTLDADLKNGIAPYGPADGWWYPDTKLKYEHRSVIVARYAERVRFSPSGKKMVTSPNRGKKCSTNGISVNDVWDEQGNLLYTFTNPWPCGLATDWFNDTENKFFVASGWGNIQSYDFEEKKLRAVRKDQVRVGWGGLEKLAWTPDVSKIACLRTSDLREIDVASGEEINITQDKLQNVCLMNFCKSETGYTFSYKICPDEGRYITRNNVLFRFCLSKSDSQHFFCQVYDKDCVGWRYIVMKHSEKSKQSEDFPKVSTTGAKIALKSSHYVPSNQKEELSFKDGCILYDVESGVSHQLPIESSPSTIQFNHNDTLMFLCMKHGVDIWDIREKPFLHATIACGYENPRVTCDKQGNKFIVSENDIYVWSRFKPTFKQLQFKLLLNAWWQTARTPENCYTPKALFAAVARRFAFNEDKTQENPVLAQELIETWQSFIFKDDRLENVSMSNGEIISMSRIQAAMWRTWQNKIKRSQEYY